MYYILPTPVELKGKLPGLGRLFSRPTHPEPLGNSELCILDNGAWGMHKRGRSWDERSLRDLESYYLRHGAEDHSPWYGVMPDAYLDPDLTVKLFEWWVQHTNKRLGPVIQFKGKKDLGMYVLAEQIRVYREYKPSIVFISNPGLTGFESGDARFLGLVSVCREHFPGAWLHVLGAGWDLQDIALWSQSGIDSIDSIAYYTDAQDGRAWWRAGESWEETAVANAVAGGFIAAGVELPCPE